ncbi:hypothetical protein ABIC11_001097 [Pseudomonas oryzihabitans]
MSDEKKSRPSNDGYQPKLQKNGYQPIQADIPNHNPPDAGYQPTSTGTNPTNPSPPKKR